MQQKGIMTWISMRHLNGTRHGYRRESGKDELEIDWKEDPGEYAERIWQWWKARKKHYPMHYLALRLIVLIIFQKLLCGESLLKAV